MRRVGVFVSGTVAVLLLGLLLVTTSAPTATPSQRLNLAVVAVDARVGGDFVRASGIVVDADDGLVLTSAHAVWGATSLKLATGLGVLHGRIVARAACDDIALVETQPRIPGLAELTVAAKPAAAGDLLTAVGRRRADPDAGASSLLTIPARAAAARGDLRLDSPLVPEAAGGPVLNAAGEVVAVATGSGEAMPWETVRDRLEELHGGPRAVYVGWHSQYRCADRLHAATRARHPAFRRSDARLNAPVPATRLPGTKELDR